MSKVNNLASTHTEKVYFSHNKSLLASQHPSRPSLPLSRREPASRVSVQRRWSLPSAERWLRFC